MSSCSSFRDFALFVAFFPQLVAGPIERAAALLPRLTQARHFDLQVFKSGGFLILFGLFKKVAIADGLAQSVDSVFNAAGSVGGFETAMATVLFAVQIYCDFSGYSDIARGTSRLLGIELMRNFHRPYFSRNPVEFWSRWHISLSTWLRDYLYIPLGGNRGGDRKTLRNLMLTMILGGLWHGAAWNFVFWGFYQGIILIIHRRLGGQELRDQDAPYTYNGVIALLTGCLRTLGFMVVVCYGWLIFRANSLGQILDFSSALLGWQANTGINLTRPTFSALLGILLLVIHEVWQERSGKTRPHEGLSLVLRAPFYAILFFLILMGMGNGPTQFIYFQF